LFGPVFEKRVEGIVVVAGVGLERLREACAAAGGIPVLALGGVTWESAERCVAAGAAGVAGIRLFG
jgi:thiamine-phosphate pyrophosphorylase